LSIALAEGTFIHCKTKTAYIVTEIAPGTHARTGQEAKAVLKSKTHLHRDNTINKFSLNKINTMYPLKVHAMEENSTCCFPTDNKGCKISRKLKISGGVTALHSAVVNGT